MGSIYQPTENKVRLLQSEKTSFPRLGYLQSGNDNSDFEEGEFVGISSKSRGRLLVEKIKAGNYVAQAKNALMRYRDTSNDVLESGAITLQKGFYELQTQLYVSGEAYQVGDLLTLRVEDSTGVLGPVESGTTTHVLARVDVPPTDSSENTPMQVTVFPTARELNT